MTGSAKSEVCYQCTVALPRGSLSQLVGQSSWMGHGASATLQPACRVSNQHERAPAADMPWTIKPGGTTCVRQLVANTPLVPNWTTEDSVSDVLVARERM